MVLLSFLSPSVCSSIRIQFFPVLRCQYYLSYQTVVRGLLACSPIDLASPDLQAPEAPKITAKNFFPKHFGQNPPVSVFTLFMVRFPLDAVPCGRCVCHRLQVRLLTLSPEMTSSKPRSRLISCSVLQSPHSPFLKHSSPHKKSKIDCDGALPCVCLPRLWYFLLLT